MAKSNYFNSYYYKIYTNLDSIDYKDLENAKNRNIPAAQNRGKIIKNIFAAHSQPGEDIYTTCESPQ